MVDSDYNDIYSPGPPLVVAEASHAWLESWQTAQGEELRSLSHDPLFADPELGDFHVRSVGGRYVPGVGWVTGGVHSPCIDAGDPDSPFGQEPDFNGTRVNVGAYGNTSEASRSLDTDGDGLSDRTEVEETATDPLVADTDGDGFSDGDEVVAGTDPLDAWSVFEIGGLTGSSGSLKLAWPRAPGRRYRILRAAGPGGEFLSLYADIPAAPPLNRQAVPVGAEAVVLSRVEVQR